MKSLIKQKKPNKFKKKLKSFFKFPEEDLQEEECKKVFEKVPLVTLTRNKIFLTIFLFLIIVNTLVGFDINYFYIRAILGFIFLITVPGLLIMLCFKIRTIKFWEFLVYTIGLSIAFIMFAGLIVNWTLPALNITDKPLSLFPILICFNLFLIALGIVAWKRNKDFEPFKLTVPKLDALNNIFFIIPMTFPALAILGAFLLNNHGSNILTMIMLGGIAVYVFMIVLFRKKLNPNIYPWALWLIGLSLLLMGSLRSWYVSGWDINLETFMFNRTKEFSFWNVKSIKNAYNSCLSITILPTIISNFTQTSINLVFKIYLQIIFSIMGVIIYLFSRRLISPLLSFFASLVYCSQPMFFEIPSWNRQEIAFIFFGLMLLVLFTKKINLTLKKTLFVIFGFSMIVSHYSTGYIALTIFTLTYVFILIYKQFENKKIKKGKIRFEHKSKFYLTGVLVLLLLVFGFLWYSQVTPTFEGIINFAHKSFSNLGNLFNEDVRGERASPLEQFNIFYKPPNLAPLVEKYPQEVLKNYNFSKFNLYSNYKSDSIKIKFSRFLEPKINKDIIYLVYLSGEISKNLIRVFLIIGIFSFLFSKGKGEKRQKDFSVLSLGTFIFFIILIFLPFISIDFNLIRINQQMLIILSPFTIIGINFAFNKFKFISKIKYSFFVLLLLLYFSLTSGFVYQIIGGTDAKIYLNNFGAIYDETFAHKSEVESINWLNYHYDPLSFAYADISMKYKTSSFGDFKFKIFEDILPNTIDRKAYVLVSETNKYFNLGYLHSKEYFKRGHVGFNFQTEFLHENKNKIYNNGGSEIFK